MVRCRSELWRVVRACRHDVAHFTLACVPRCTRLLPCDRDQRLVSTLLSIMPFAVPFATRANIYDQRRLADLEAHRVRAVGRGVVALQVRVC